MNLTSNEMLFIGAITVIILLAGLDAVGLWLDRRYK